MERLKCERIRDSTRKNYYSVWKLFNQFFVRLDVKPKEWADRIPLFVAYLVHNKYKSQTVRSYLSAIRGVLREDGIKLTTDSFLLSALTRACKLKNDRVKTQLPIHWGMLTLLIRKTLDHFEAINQTYLATLYVAIFATMYFGLLRVGEVGMGSHPIKVQDVHVAQNKQKILLLLRSSKTHNKG